VVQEIHSPRRSPPSLVKMKFTVLFAALVPVGSANKTSQCVAGNCNSEGLGLFQSRERLTKLEGLDSNDANFQDVASYMRGIVKQNSSDVQTHGFADVETYVEQLAAKDAGPGYTMTNDELSAVESIKKMIMNVEKHNDEEHNAVQKSIDEATRAIEKCVSSTENDLKVVAGHKTALGVSRADHAKCREQEVADHDEKSEACEAWDVLRKNQDNNDKWDELTQNIKINEEEPSKKLAMESHIMDSFPWITTLHEKLKECSEKIDKHANKTEICKKNQGAFEKQFCLYSQELDKTCQGQDICLNSTIPTRSSLDTSAQIFEVASKADFKAGGKITCFLLVFKANASEKHKIYEKCKNLKIDASKYNFTYPDIPKPAACEKEPTRPCNGAWTATEYSDQPWFAKAEVETCDPCEPETTTTTNTGPAPGADLGFNHPVTCSSGCKNFYGNGFLASNGVIDETHGAKTQTGGLAHTHVQKNAWVEVNFEKEFHMGKVTMWNGWQWGCCMDRINPFRLVFFDASHNEVKRVTGLTAKTSGDGETPILLTSTVTAQYVRVQTERTAYVHIAELRAYAPEVTSVPVGHLQE